MKKKERDEEGAKEEEEEFGFCWCCCFERSEPMTKRGENVLDLNCQMMVAWLASDSQVIEL